MRIKVFFLLLVSVFYGNLSHAQSLSKKDISLSSVEVILDYSKIRFALPYLPNLYARGGTSDYRDNLHKVVQLVNKDIIRYWGLAEKYDTPLKKKIFLESEDGLKYQKRINKDYNEFMNESFYFEYQFTSRYMAEYNIDKKGFLVSAPQILECISKKKVDGYIAFNNLQLSIPTSLKYEAKYNSASTHSTGCRCYDQTIFVPLTDMNIALQIEENLKNYSLLFCFKVKGTDKDDNLLTTTSSVYIHNIETGELYSIK